MDVSLVIDNDNRKAFGYQWPRNGHAVAAKSR